MLIDEALLQEIELKKNKIGSHPEHFSRRAQKIKEGLRASGDVYSWYQENPEIRDRIVQEIHVRNIDRLRKTARKGVRNLANAWDYLIHTPALNQDGKSFLECLQKQQILKVGKLVDPEQNIGGYRNRNVTLGFPGMYMPPNPQEIPEEVAHLLIKGKDGDLHPLERAIYFHLHLAAIQPFDSGNKRVGRLVQDAILDDCGYPPAIIHPGERKPYMEVFANALTGIRAGKVELKMQRPFFDFVASKVNIALDDTLGYMNSEIRNRGLHNTNELSQ